MLRKRKTPVKRNRFLRNIVFLLVFLIIINLVLFEFEVIPAPIFYSLLAAQIITFINFIFGVYSIKKGLKQADKSFLLVVFGGMVVRMFFMLLMIIIGLEFLELRTNYFIFSIFLLYFFLLIIEIVYLIRINPSKFEEK